MDLVIKDSLVTTKKTFLNELKIETHSTINSKQISSKREIQYLPSEEVKEIEPFNSKGQINPFQTVEKQEINEGLLNFNSELKEIYDEFNAKPERSMLTPLSDFKQQVNSLTSMVKDIKEVSRYNTSTRKSRCKAVPLDLKHTKIAKQESQIMHQDDFINEKMQALF